MSNNALVLLYRIYLDSKKKSEADGYDTVEKYLLHHNFFQTDEKLSKDNWDEDLFRNCRSMDMWMSITKTVFESKMPGLNI